MMIYSHRTLADSQIRMTILENIIALDAHEIESAFS